MFLLTCREPEQGEIVILDCQTRDEAEQTQKSLEGWSDFHLYESQKSLDRKQLDVLRALFMSTHPTVVAEAFLSKVGIVPV